MENRRILIVADLEERRQLLMDIFERKGFRVQTAATGWQALDAVECAAFDLIIADLDLPLLGERELAQALQKRYVRPPVIALSDDPTRLTRDSGLPVAAVIGKPFTIATLLALIDDVIPGPEKDTPDAAHDRPA